MSNVGLTTTLKNNSVNTFRFTYMRSALHTNNPLSKGPSLSDLGFVTPWGPTGGVDVVNPDLQGVPNTTFTNFTFGTPNSTNVRVNNSFQWLDNYMMVVKTHTLQFGLNYHYDQINGRNFYAVNGQLSYSGGNETGIDTADFLLGAVNTFTQATPQLLDSRSHYAGGYAEDSWRIVSSLTLNYGIRYEVSTPWYDTQNKIETIIPGQQSIVFPGAPKGWVFPGDPGVARTLAPIKWNKFAPRFGFSYVPTWLDQQDKHPRWLRSLLYKLSGSVGLRRNWRRTLRLVLSVSCARYGRKAIRGPRNAKYTVTEVSLHLSSYECLPVQSGQQHSVGRAIFL